eukprot:6296350-Prymnesium_polylepis.1
MILRPNVSAVIIELQVAVSISISGEWRGELVAGVNGNLDTHPSSLAGRLESPQISPGAHVGAVLRLKPARGQLARTNDPKVRRHTATDSPRHLRLHQAQCG